MHDVFTDLAGESDELDALVAGLPPRDLHRGTPVPGWTIARHVAHLGLLARRVRSAAREPDGSAATSAATSAADSARTDAATDVRATAAEASADEPVEPVEPFPVLLARWRAERADAERALAARPRDAVLPWPDGPLRPSVLAAAALTEVFGHGQDVRDGLRLEREPTDRIGHVAFFGAHTWEFGYLERGLRPPAVALRFELTAPSGARWAFGPKGAAQRVIGPALDFCLLVTRRRNRADLALEPVGDGADQWLDLAQAFRGPRAGDTLRPGTFA